MASHLPDVDKKTLRRQLRALRRSLSKTQQQKASFLIGRKLNALGRVGRNIAAYLACDGEIALPRTFIRTHTIFLPCLHPNKQFGLGFRLIGKTRLSHLQIPEPARGKPYLAWQLDMILLPLVGFDQQGHRLGMGGGFYDRALADLARRPKRPLLIGLAHDCQECPIIPQDPWDYPLDGIMTPHHTFWRRPITNKHLL